MLFLAATTAEAVLVAYLPFDGGSTGSPGQSLADTSSTGAGAISFTSDFSGFVSEGNSEYVAGLTGSTGGSGNALSVGVGGSFRMRAILDRSGGTPLDNSVVLESNDDQALIGASTLYGSVLIQNQAAPLGFTGLEFAVGNPNSNRKLTIGEAGNDGKDYVVLGGGTATPGDANSLELPAVIPGLTREITFRIDYAASGSDTFTLINADGTDGASGTGEFSFSTLHLASFSGSPSVTYDEIRLGTTLGDVWVAAIPEPSGFLGMALIGSFFGFVRMNPRRGN